jgi:hypothetical protein
MFSNLFRSSAGEGAVGRATELEPHRAEVEFALVLVEAPADQQLVHTIQAVTGSVADYGGTVLQILGPLIFVGFSGAPGSAAKSQRQAFVAHVCASYRIFVKIVHGSGSGLVGMFGCTARVAYTAIPAQFGSILKQLSELAPGQAVEHGAQQSASPNAGPDTLSGGFCGNAKLR